MPETKHEAPKEQDTSKKDEKTNIVFWAGLIAVILLIAGFVYYWFFWREKVDTGNGADQTTPVEESTTDDETEEVTDQITWKTFTEEDAPYDPISFEYPEEAKVTWVQEYDEEVCEETSECYKLKIVYEQITIEIEGVTGIGGEPSQFGRPYIVVSGTQLSGVARTYIKDGANIVGSYSPFDSGGLVPVRAEWVSYTVPESRYNELISVADRVACTFYDYEQRERPVYGLAYSDSDDAKVYGLTTTGETYEIVDYSGTDERGWNLIISPREEYLAIYSADKSSGDVFDTYYLAVYDFTNRELVKIDGEALHDELDGLPIWVSNTDIITSIYDTNTAETTYYKYDVSEGTRTEITQTEFENLREEFQ